MPTVAMELLEGRIRRRRWSDEDKRRIVYEGLRSGIGLSRFARMSGLQPSVLFRWRNTFAQFVDAIPDAPNGHPGFAIVQVASSPRQAAAAPCQTDGVVAPAADVIEIVLAGGHRVRVGRDVDAAALRRVLSVLETSP